jgi:hypothetical protein
MRSLPLQAQEDHRREGSRERVIAKIARIPPKSVSKSDDEPC